jgi:restriction endonuclease Mrr
LKIITGIFFIAGFAILFIIQNNYNKDEIIQKKYLAEKNRVEEENIKRKLRDEEQYEKSQKAKGLIKITRYGKEHWVTQEQEREWKFIDVDLENNFQKLSPRQFEKAIQDLFIKMNYDVTLTKYTGDYEADLIIRIQKPSLYNVKNT